MVDYARISFLMHKYGRIMEVRAQEQGLEISGTSTIQRKLR